MLEKTPECPLESKEIIPVNRKGDQSWISIGRTDAEAEAPIFWLPDAKNWLIGKDPDAGKDWGQEEKGTTEDEMVGWHHWLSGHEFEQSLGVDDGQGSLACCSPWSCRVRQDWVTEVNWTWANSRRQWKTGKPAVLQPMGSQRVRHDLVIEQTIGMAWYRKKNMLTLGGLLNFHLLSFTRS